MPRAPRRKRRRHRPIRLRTSGPTFPVRVIRAATDRGGEEAPLVRDEEKERGADLLISDTEAWTNLIAAFPGAEEVVSG
jgi:hypothetical protein